MTLPRRDLSSVEQEVAHLLARAHALCGRDGEKLAMAEYLIGMAYHEIMGDFPPVRNDRNPHA